MTFFGLFKRGGSAPVARDRLQILLAYERTGRGFPDLLFVLREELMATIKRHVEIDPEGITVQMERGDKVSTLELEIEIPNIVRAAPSGGRKKRAPRHAPALKIAARVQPGHCLPASARRVEADGARGTMRGSRSFSRAAPTALVACKSTPPRSSRERPIAAQRSRSGCMPSRVLSSGRRHPSTPASIRSHRCAYRKTCARQAQRQACYPIRLLRPQRFFLSAWHTAPGAALFAPEIPARRRSRSADADRVLASQSPPMRRSSRRSPRRPASPPRRARCSETFVRFRPRLRAPLPVPRVP